MLPQWAIELPCGQIIKLRVKHERYTAKPEMQVKMTKYALMYICGMLLAEKLCISFTKWKEFLLYIK